jgi:hypothetical protein
MKFHILLGALLAVFGTAVFPQVKAPATRSQICDEVTRAYESAARTKKTEVIQTAKARVLKECFPVRARSPVLQKPVSVDSTIRPIAPVRVTPVISSHALVPSPAVLSTCDAGGCWDNQGKRYNGTDSTLIGPAGGLCIRSGNRVDCR